MQQVEVLVVGAGPAGLSAAAEAAKLGAAVLLIDENAKPGGQLFKQIHKFFGSRDHRAGTRGYDIGTSLLEETTRLGAKIELNSVVYAIYPDLRVGIIRGGETHQLLSPQKIILATGASENALTFPGCTLPGVMSAGAVQTMVNLHRVLPAQNTLMIGSGNVGLIVSYQIIQAGGKVAALVEAAPSIGGYGVHSAKVSRAGVPILTSHTVLHAYGKNQVEGAVIVTLDEKFRPVAGTEQDIKVGCISIAVGLTPLTELATMCGCEFIYVPRLGGHLPLHDEDMETTAPGIYVAGDISGVEEASSAMEEGRLAGIAAAESLGHVTPDTAKILKSEVKRRLDALRTGRFGQARRDAKNMIVNEGRKCLVK